LSDLEAHLRYFKIELALAQIKQAAEFFSNRLLCAPDALPGAKQEKQMNIQTEVNRCGVRW